MNANYKYLQQDNGAGVVILRSVEKSPLWGGPPGPRPTPSSASVLSLMPGPDQGVRRGRGRPPHEMCSELYVRGVMAAQHLANDWPVR
jgi:hypothetical protein